MPLRMAFLSVHASKEKYLPRLCDHSTSEKQPSVGFLGSCKRLENSKEIANVATFHPEIQLIRLLGIINLIQLKEAQTIPNQFQVTLT